MSRASMNDLMMSNGFSFAGEGSARRTYLGFDKQYVIKVPVRGAGEYANKREHDTYRNGNDIFDPFDKRLAPCRLINDYALIMQAVEDDMGFHDFDEIKKILSVRDDVEFSRDLRWIHNIDAYQVGLLNGRLVTYDYE